VPLVGASAFDRKARVARPGPSLSLRVRPGERYPSTRLAGQVPGRDFRTRFLRIVAAVDTGLLVQAKTAAIDGASLTQQASILDADPGDALAATLAKLARSLGARSA
jgi:hypothetical protein